MVDIVEIVTFRTKSWLPAPDSCCWEMRTWLILPRSLHITCCQITSETKHPRFCFPRFVSVWPAPEVVDGIFEVCPSATKFCPLVNKPVALFLSLWWQFFDISKHFCPLVRLGPNSSMNTNYPDSSSGIRLFARIYTQTNCETNYRSLPKFVPDGWSVPSINRANSFSSKHEIKQF